MGIFSACAFLTILERLYFLLLHIAITGRSRPSSRIHVGFIIFFYGGKRVFSSLFNGIDVDILCPFGVQDEGVLPHTRTQYYILLICADNHLEDMGTNNQHQTKKGR